MGMRNYKFICLATSIIVILTFPDPNLAKSKNRDAWLSRAVRKCVVGKRFKDPSGSCNTCKCIMPKTAMCTSRVCNETDDNQKRHDDKPMVLFNEVTTKSYGSHKEGTEELDEEEEREEYIFCKLGDKPFIDRCRKCVCTGKNLANCRRISNCVLEATTETPEPAFTRTTSEPYYSEKVFTTKKPVPYYPAFAETTSEPYYTQEVFASKTPELYYPEFTSTTPKPYYTEKDFNTPHTEADYVEKDLYATNTKCDPSDKPLIDGCKRCVCYKNNVMGCRKIPNCHYWDHLPNDIKFVKEPPPDFMPPEITTAMYEKCEFGSEPIIDLCRNCTCLKNGAMRCRKIPNCNTYDQLMNRNVLSNSKGSCRNTDMEFSKEKCLCICVKNKPWCPYHKWNLRCPWTESPLAKWKEAKRLRKS